MEVMDYRNNNIQNIDAFIKFYEPLYFINSKGRIKNVRKCSRWIEDQIETVLENGIKNIPDVYYILAWKLGKVKHKESETLQDWVLARDWADIKNYHVFRYGRELNLYDFAKYIVDNISILETLDIQDLLNNLALHTVEGIGPTYIITLAYFISKGKYPICDKFAMIALEQISCANEEFKYKKTDLPSSCNVGAFNKVASTPDGAYRRYFDAIKYYVAKSKIVSFDDVHSFRRLDRALWVYGHSGEYVN